MLVFRRMNIKRRNTSLDLDGESDILPKEDEHLEEATRIGWKQPPKNKKLSRKISFGEK